MSKYQDYDSHSIQAISNKFKNTPPLVALPKTDEISDEYIQSKTKNNDENYEFKLDDIHSPAFLINYNFEIEWINQSAEKRFFFNNVSSIHNLKDRNIFKLFLNHEIQAETQNQTKIIALHIAALMPELDKKRLSTLFYDISKSEIKYLEKLFDRIITEPKRKNMPVPAELLLRDGTIHKYNLHCIRFREGILFLYVPEGENTDLIPRSFASRDIIISELMKKRLPSQISLCVIAAQLHNASKINTELLPKDYFELTNRLRQIASTAFIYSGGTLGENAGDIMLCYFIKQHNSKYITDAIDCALNLRTKIREFSSDWKRQKGFITDLDLNIGIAEGYEFFGPIRSALHTELLVFGNSINCAKSLSGFAKMGEIWITKNVINKVELDTLQNIKFGIHRIHNHQPIFIPNSFSSIIDLLENTDQEIKKSSEFASLTITEIIDKK